MRFTDLTVRSLAAPLKGQKAYYDDTLPSFGCRVSQGGTRSFFVQVGADRRFITIGRYHPDILSLSQARTEAKRLLAEHVLGKHRPRSIAFDEAKTLFLAKCNAEVRPRTLYDYTRLLNRHFKFRGTQVSDIAPQDIYRKLDSIKKPSERAYAGTVIKIFFKWCVERHYVAISPAASVPGRTVKKRSRILSDAELESIWSACVRGHNILPASFSRIVQTLILTGLRRGECAQIKSEYVNDDLLVLPPEITKNGREHVLPLPSFARKLLTSTSGYVFPGRRHGRIFSGWSKSKKALDELSGVSGWTLHDIRRSFRTNLAKLKVAPHVAEMLVNHVSSRDPMTQIYDRHSYLAEKREAMERHEACLKGVLGLP